MRMQNTRKNIIVRDNRHYKKLRVIHDSDNLGVMDTRQALERAWKSKADLILINQDSNPPVAKILDANKFSIGSLLSTIILFPVILLRPRIRG